MKKLGWMLAGLCCVGLAFPCVHAASVSFSVDKSEVEEGQAVKVTFNLADAPAFSTWGQLVRFDKEKLQLIAQDGGSFVTFVPDSRGLSDVNASGEVRAGGFGMDDNKGGSGSLGVFSFKTLKSGVARIWTANASPDNPFGNVLKNKAGDSTLPTILGDLTVTIVAKSGGGDPGGGTDTDGDGIPNVNDPDDDNDGIPDFTDPDDDNDGIPDTQDPDQAGVQAEDEQLRISDALAKLKFSTDGLDMIRVNGYLPVPDGFVFEGQVVDVDFGGVVRQFTLDPKGRDIDGTNQFRIKAKTRDKEVFAQDAKFQLKLTKGSFKTALEDEGMEDKNAQGEEVQVIMGILFNGTAYVTPGADPLNLLYNAKEGKSAMARTAK